MVLEIVFGQQFQLTHCYFMYVHDRPGWKTTLSDLFDTHNLCFFVYSGSYSPCVSVCTEICLLFLRLFFDNNFIWHIIILFMFMADRGRKLPCQNFFDVHSLCFFVYSGSCTVINTYTRIIKINNSLMEMWQNPENVSLSYFNGKITRQKSAITKCGIVVSHRKDKRKQNEICKCCDTCQRF